MNIVDYLVLAIPLAKNTGNINNWINSGDLTNRVNKALIEFN